MLFFSMLCLRYWLPRYTIVLPLFALLVLLIAKMYNCIGTFYSAFIIDCQDIQLYCHFLLCQFYWLVKYATALPFFLLCSDSLQPWDRMHVHSALVETGWQQLLGQHCHARATGHAVSEWRATHCLCQPGHWVSTYYVRSACHRRNILVGKVSQWMKGRGNGFVWLRGFQCGSLTQRWQVKLSEREMLQQILVGFTCLFP